MPVRFLGIVLLCLGWFLLATVTLERPESQMAIKAWLGFGCCLVGLFLCFGTQKREIVREVRQQLERRE